MRRAYDPDMTPPGPLLEVVLAHPLDGFATQPLIGKVDTGAGVTMVPTRVVTQLGLQRRGWAWVFAPGRKRVLHPTYEIDVTVEGQTPRRQLIVAAKRPNVLLGRDVLNHFVLTLDGPKRTLTLAR